MQVDADQRRRDDPELSGTAFRQAFNLLQRRQIRSPNPSLQKTTSHLRQGRFRGMSPKALSGAMSGAATSAMALF
ncbi:MAG: hypothetical protein WBV71_12430, partial [Roseobacter sp.]